MAATTHLSNADLQFLNVSNRDFTIYLAFLNPISITSTWTSLNMDAQGNWQPPPNFDTAAHKVAPYAPVANLGSNRIGFCNEPLYFDGTRSFQRFDLPVVSYTWAATGSPAQTLYANGSQIGYSWSSPGIYTVTLTVKDRAGTAKSSIRQVMIYQDRQNALPGMLQLSGPSGSLSNGGWQCQLTTVNSQFTLFQPDSLPVGSYQPVVLMVETRYELTPGNWVNRTVGPNGQFNPGSPYMDPRILFDGYVQTNSVHSDVDKDTLSLTCVGLQMILNDASAHLVGYYNCAYTSVANGIPTGCKTSTLGMGFQVGGLMTNDIIQSMLQYHSNMCQFCDLHMWNSLIPCAPYIGGSQNAYYTPQYSTLSVNEGKLWSNLQDLTNNEWSQVYCERDGSLRIGPQMNYRGQEYWLKPWLYNNTSVTAGTYINLLQDLGYTITPPSSILNTTTIPATLPPVPALPIPVVFVHEWGHQQLPSLYVRPFQGVPDPDMVQQFSSQFGPPLLCTFSDVPLYDTASAPPAQGLLPGAAYNWPQDLALYPIAMDIQENYTGRTAAVKLIGTLAQAQTILTSWHPVNVFSVTGDGTSTIVISVLPAGTLNVDESHVVPDVTAGLNRSLVLNWWWEVAHRTYYASNINYNITITMGELTCVNLNDLVGVTRQNATLGPRWANKPFYVDGVTYQIDLNAKTWVTSLTLTEITSANLGPIQPPPKVVPKW
jgi:PKD repeat protein